MPQKLSAMNYIKNNKRRTAVLIVSLGLCFVLTYLTQFLLSSSEETMRVLLLGSAEKCQYINLMPDTLGIDSDSISYEELAVEYFDKNRELAKKLEKHEGIKKTYCAQIYYETIKAPITSMNVEMPFVSKEEVPEIIECMDARLISGRMPEEPGEMLLDEASMKNGGYELNDIYEEEYYDDLFKIVGVLDCDVYFGCGVAIGGSVEEGGMGMIAVFSEGAPDIRAMLSEEGLTLSKRDGIVDQKWAKEYMKTEITDAFESATKYVYVGILILLSISLIIVYTMYLRDRHNEWCLYCSIGYSRRTIYFSIMRELLFTFITALLAGGAVIALSIIALDRIMMEPEGLRCRYFHPDTLRQILCSYVLILGILQIPVRYALGRIRTIDAMDDELH